MRKAITFLFLSAPCFAAGPKYIGQQTSPDVALEFGNVYQDLKNPIINYGSASSFTVTNLTVSTMTVSSITVNGLSLNGHKITNLANGTSSTDAAAFGQIKLLQTKTGNSSAAINVLSTNAAVVSTTSTNSISFTPTVTNSTTTITITVNVACDGMSSGSAIYVVVVIDNTASTVQGMMQAAGFSGHLVWNQTFTYPKFFGDTNAHTIQVGAYKVGTVTNAVISGDTAPGTFYTIQEVVF